MCASSFLHNQLKLIYSIHFNFSFSYVCFDVSCDGIYACYFVRCFFILFYIFLHRNCHFLLFMAFTHQQRHFRLFHCNSHNAYATQCHCILQNYICFMHGAWLLDCCYNIFVIFVMVG